MIVADQRPNIYEQMSLESVFANPPSLVGLANKESGEEAKERVPFFYDDEDTVEYDPNFGTTTSGEGPAAEEQKPQSPAVVVEQESVEGQGQDAASPARQSPPQQAPQEEEEAAVEERAFNLDNLTPPHHSRRRHHKSHHSNKSHKRNGSRRNSHRHADIQEHDEHVPQKAEVPEAVAQEEEQEQQKEEVEACPLDREDQTVPSGSNSDPQNSMEAADLEDGELEDGEIDEEPPENGPPRLSPHYPTRDGQPPEENSNSDMDDRPKDIDRKDDSGTGEDVQTKRSERKKRRDNKKKKRQKNRKKEEGRKKRARYLDHDRMDEDAAGAGWAPGFQSGRSPSSSYGGRQPLGHGGRSPPGPYDSPYESPPGPYDSPSDDDEYAPPAKMMRKAGKKESMLDMLDEDDYMDPEVAAQEKQDIFQAQVRGGMSMGKMKRMEKSRMYKEMQRQRQEKKQNPPRQRCKFYMEGKCAKGQNCSFSHDFKPPRKTEVCKFYINNMCAKGKDCVYMHGDYPCKYFHMGETCLMEDNCKFSHDPLDDHTRPIFQKICNEDHDFVTMMLQQQQNQSPSKMQKRGSQRRPANGDHQNMQNPDLKKIPSLFDIEVFPPAKPAGDGPAGGEDTPHQGEEDTPGEGAMSSSSSSAKQTTAAEPTVAGDNNGLMAKPHGLPPSGPAHALSPRGPPPAVPRPPISGPSTRMLSPGILSNQQQHPMGGLGEPHPRDPGVLSSMRPRFYADLPPGGAPMSHQPGLLGPPPTMLRPPRLGMPPGIHPLGSPAEHVRFPPPNMEPGIYGPGPDKKPPPPPTSQSAGDTIQSPESDQRQTPLTPNLETQLSSDPQASPSQSGLSGFGSQEDGRMSDFPAHLPPKQRELFLRIQQQQRQNDYVPDDQQEDQDERKMVEDDNWYSSDEEEGSAPKSNLATILKTLSQSSNSQVPSGPAAPFDIAKVLTAIQAHPHDETGPAQPPGPGSGPAHPGLMNRDPRQQPAMTGPPPAWTLDPRRRGSDVRPERPLDPRMEASSSSMPLKQQRCDPRTGARPPGRPDPRQHDPRLRSQQTMPIEQLMVQMAAEGGGNMDNNNMGGGGGGGGGGMQQGPPFIPPPSQRQGPYQQQQQHPQQQQFPPFSPRQEQHDQHPPFQQQQQQHPQYHHHHHQQPPPQHQHQHQHQQLPFQQMHHRHHQQQPPPPQQPVIIHCTVDADGVGGIPYVMRKVTCPGPSLPPHMNASDPRFKDDPRVAKYGQGQPPQQPPGDPRALKHPRLQGAAGSGGDKCDPRLAKMMPGNLSPHNSASSQGHFDHRMHKTNSGALASSSSSSMTTTNSDPRIAKSDEQARTNFPRVSRSGSSSAVPPVSPALTSMPVNLQQPPPPPPRGLTDPRQMKPLGLPAFNTDPRDSPPMPSLPPFIPPKPTTPLHKTASISPCHSPRREEAPSAAAAAAAADKPVAPDKALSHRNDPRFKKKPRSESTSAGMSPNPHTDPRQKSSDPRKSFEHRSPLDSTKKGSSEPSFSSFGRAPPAHHKLTNDPAGGEPAPKLEAPPGGSGTRPTPTTTTPQVLGPARHFSMPQVSMAQPSVPARHASLPPLLVPPDAAAMAFSGGRDTGGGSDADMGAEEDNDPDRCLKDVFKTIDPTASPFC